MSELKVFFTQIALDFEIVSNTTNCFEIEAYVWAKPGAKKTKITTQEGKLVVAINEKPVDGQANQGIVKYLSKSFGIAQGHIELCSGLKSKHKKFKFRFDFTNSKNVSYYLEKLEKAISK